LEKVFDKLKIFQYPGYIMINLPMKRLFLLFFFFILAVIGFSLFLPKTFAASSAILSLSSSKDNPAVNETFEVTVALNTAGAQTPGVDVILLFDPDKLEAQEIIKGNAFPQYVYQNIDNQKGRVSISGIIRLDGPPFSGRGTFAKVKFKAQSPGRTTINFDFAEGERNDSNVALFGTPDDILGKAQGTTITISKTTRKVGITNLIALPFNWLKNLFSKFFNLFRVW